MAKYTPIIGLEVHIELETGSKMFCECPAEHFRAEPNSQTCPICLGLPGSMPFANKKAIEQTVRLGQAIGCKINNFSKFDRKHYFYPDLPKAFQISQYDLPLCEKGRFEYESDGKKRSINITRIHLEEDTGKLVHRTINGKTMSLIDFNRSGVPLLELVTEPEFSSVDDSIAFLKELQLVVRYLGISGADMEKGSMRLEANVSVAEAGWKELPDFKVELKNINSFRFMENAVTAEIERLTAMLRSGDEIIQETRGYDEEKGITFSQRSKEEAKDYRYFPEPDLPPIELAAKELDRLSDALEQLPSEKRELFRKKFNLPENYVEVLVGDKTRADFFEAAAKIAKEQGIEPKLIANQMVNQNLDERYKTPKSMVGQIKEETQIQTADEGKTLEVVKKVISDNQGPVEEYKQGKEQVIGFLIGQVMQQLKGKGDPNLAKELLQKQLD